MYSSPEAVNELKKWDLSIDRETLRVRTFPILVARQGDTQGTYISYISSSTGRHSVSEYVRRTFPILVLVETGKHSGYVSYFHPLRMYCLQMIVFNSPKLLFRRLFNDSYFH